MKNVRVHFKKWEPVGKMEGYDSKMGTTEEYNSKTGADLKLYIRTVLKTGAGQKLLKLGVKEYHKSERVQIHFTKNGPSRKV